MTSEQLRAARALLRWEQKDLAEKSLVSLTTVKRLESKPGLIQANALTIEALRRACEAAGVTFTNGDEPGVKMRAGSRPPG